MNKDKSLKKEIEAEDEVEKRASEILEKLREKIFDMGDPPYEKPKHYKELKKEKLKEIQGAPVCSACLNRISKGDLVITMPCCGCWCHIQCISLIALTHKHFMNHACPKCTHPFDDDFQRILIKMGSVIKKSSN